MPSLLSTIQLVCQVRHLTRGWCLLKRFDLNFVRGTRCEKVMKYKCVVVTRRGGPEVLQVVEEELPEPKFGEVRVKILAAGVSGTDVILREVKVSGFSTPPMPFSFGADLVGVVDELGDRVNNLAWT